jgi:hypothetical protein
MNRSRLLVLVSGLFCAACVVIAGCSMNSTEDTSDEGLIPPKAGSAAGVQLKEIESKDYGTIMGTVTYDGTPPSRPDINMGNHKDKAVCMQGEHQDQTWIVDSASKGVENVVVWVNPPKGSYFPKPDDQHKAWQDAVTVDQPHCVFVPHVVVLYPEYFNGKDRVATGQVLKVLNTAEVGHNIKIAGSSQLNPTIDGGMMPVKTGVVEFKKLKVDTQEISLNCNVHTWMTGYALTFDHPYAARTNSKGQFVIKNVPAGVELTFKGWHEGVQPKRFDPAVEGGAKFTLKPGETKQLNFKIAAK